MLGIKLSGEKSLLRFIKPTKVKIVLSLLILITLWSSIKLEKAVNPIAFELCFPKMTDYIKEAVESVPGGYKEELTKIGKELNNTIDSDNKIVRKTTFILLITFLSQVLPCYLCSCIIVFLTKNRLTKERVNNQLEAKRN